MGGCNRSVIGNWDRDRCSDHDYHWSKHMQTHRTTSRGFVSPIDSGGPRWRRTIVALAIVAAGVAATACGSDTEESSTAAGESATPTETVPAEPETVASEVVIDIFLYLSGERANTGTFVVSDGGDSLGCDTGRFYLSANDQNVSFMTCEAGSNTGEFKMLIDPTLGADETFTGTWTIVSGTGDFETLSGGGEFEDVRDVPAGSIIGARTGEIEFDVEGG